MQSIFLFDSAYKLRASELKKLESALKMANNKSMEVCGIVVVDKTNYLSLFLTKNQSSREGEFRISSIAIKRIKSKLRNSSKTILGSFHTHPIWFAVPGKEDFQHAFYNGYALIYDVCGKEIRLWKKVRKKKKSYCEEALLLVEKIIKGKSTWCANLKKTLL